MNNNMTAIVVLVLGALILLASALADVIGLGDDPGFGRQQTIGVLLGAVVLAVGAYLRRKSGQASGNEPDEASEE